MLIAGDIGGTKTLLALFTPEQGAGKPVAEAEFHSRDFAGLGPMVRGFLQTIGRTAEVACFDVAGPVLAGRAQLTNLPWIIDAEELRRELGLRSVFLLNDLKATAYAVPRLTPADLRVINPGKPEPQGPIAVIAPGTGLGEAFLVWAGGEYVACSSEGGHENFGPADQQQTELLGYLRGRYGHVAQERVCSGSGLPNIYDFLREQGALAESADFAAQLAAASDRTPLIVEAALQDPSANPLSAATLEIFVSALGAEAGNLALKVLATGGVFVAGGMPPRILPWLEDGRFMRAFVDKGRFAELLRGIPVSVVVSRAALLGAALFGLDRLRAAAADR